MFVPIIFPKQFFKFYFGFIAFGFAGYSVSNYYREVKWESELKSFSHSTKGIVKGKRYLDLRKGTGHWEFFCEFQDSKKNYKTFYERDMKNQIHDGDTLEIKFLKRNPEISRILLPADY